MNPYDPNMNQPGMGQPGGGWDQLLNQMTPEQLERLMQLGALEEENGTLDRQMAEADALRQPSGRQYGDGQSAGLGAVGDIFNSITGMKKKNAAEEKQAANRKTQTDIRTQQAKSLADALRARNGGTLRTTTTPTYAPSSFQMTNDYWNNNV